MIPQRPTGRHFFPCSPRLGNGIPAETAQADRLATDNQTARSSYRKQGVGMPRYSLYTVDTARWRALLNEAQSAADCELDAGVESYLVLMLMRFLGQPGAAKSGLMGERLPEHLAQRERWSAESLREIAEQCLLFAGVFPDHAERSAMPVTYFVDMGRRAYAELARTPDSDVFKQVRDSFVDIIDVLQNLRDLDDGQRCLGLLSAHDLWVKTGSRHAFKVLRETTRALPSFAPMLLLH
jgi:hypothetical protein